MWKQLLCLTFRAIRDYESKAEWLSEPGMALKVRLRGCFTQVLRLLQILGFPPPRIATGIWQAASGVRKSRDSLRGLAASTTCWIEDILIFWPARYFPK